MMKIFKTVLAAGVAIAAVNILRRWLNQRSERSFVRTSNDFKYSAVPPDLLAAKHLADLNSTDLAGLLDLGIEPEMAERIIENRPFRSKLELLSRRIIAEEVYEKIKDRVAVANANEAIKIA
jgi:hypothetical protein